MSIIDEALSANATIANDYDPGRGKPPAPKIAIVTCADPRLSNIVQMLGLADGDVDMIRNFGTVIDDDSIRSLVLSTRLLGTREIMIINHTDCGMLKFTDSELEDRLRKETGPAPIAPARFYSFTDAEENTREQIQKARSHPWISPEVPIRGFIYDVATGRLSEVLSPHGERVTGQSLAAGRSDDAKPSDAGLARRLQGTAAGECRPAPGVAGTSAAPTFAPAGRLHPVPDDVLVSDVTAGGVPATGSPPRERTPAGCSSSCTAAVTSSGRFAATVSWPPGWDGPAGCGCCSPNIAWPPSIRSPPPSTTSWPRGAGSAPTRAQVTGGGRRLGRRRARGGAARGHA